MDEESIFEAAIEKATPEDRAAYVAQVCGDDVQLQSRVSALLSAYDHPDSFLDTPAGGLGTKGPRPVSEGPGTQIGSYKLLQEIGEGGFGVVYMAEQRRPVRRKVALKIIKPGMDSRAVVARFEAERQALAIMDHPHIARVFDGGTTDNGRPYFVMELVQGVPITQYCDANQLGVGERLELFETVCHAVQHAHQKGIIHRDLKPSNIMVTLRDGQPVVKVIDFGVSKALNQQLTEKTLFTNFGQMVGTPQYMSPEQAEMSELDVDTRSDIYSLGVVLYEILTGTTPLESQQLRAAGYAEIQRMICEEEPARPSIRLSTVDHQQRTVIASHRSETPDRLRENVKGDLDAIVMKALSKDRRRRYETAYNFQLDVQRYLSNEPVLAQSPSLAYRAKKFCQRNRGVVAAAGVIAGCILVGVVSTTWLGLAAHDAATRTKEANRQLVEVHTDLHKALVDSVRHAPPGELSAAIGSLGPLHVEALPVLQSRFEDDSASRHERLNAAFALAAYGRAEQVNRFLLNHIMDIDARLSHNFIEAIRSDPEIAKSLEAEAQKARESGDIRRLARLAIVALHCDHVEPARDMLRFRLDMLQRTIFLDSYQSWRGSPGDLLKHLHTNDPAFRSGIILAAGLASVDELTDDQRKQWVGQLQSAFASTADTATHSAADWTLRRWGVPFPNMAPTESTSSANLYRNSVGMTMLKIPAGRFTLGTMTGEAENPSREARLTRPFYLADREVTYATFRKFFQEDAIERKRRPWYVKWRDYGKERGLPAEHPAMAVTYFDALRFCNWLSDREGLDRYYVHPEGKVTKSAFAWKPVRDADGYRLPFEAEWEHACRAGSVTQYSWGQSSEVGRLFGAQNRSQRSPGVGGKTLPNALGLFDMHGSLREYCYGRRETLPLSLSAGALTDYVPKSIISDGISRGGGWEDPLVQLGSSIRSDVYIWFVADAAQGFRVARNVPNSAPKSDDGIVRDAPSDDESERRIAELTRAIAINGEKNLVDHFMARGRAYAALGDVENAIADYLRVLNLIPRHEDCRLFKTRYLLQLADDANVYAQLMKARPQDKHLWICRGRHHAIHRRWAKAADDFGTVIRSRNPTNSNWLQLGADQEWSEYACLLLLAGRSAEYQEFRRWVASQAENNKDHVGLLWSAIKVWMHAPITHPEDQELVRGWISLCARAGLYLSAVDAVVHYRRGDFDGLADVNLKHGWNLGKRIVQPVMAMLHHQQGRGAQAKQLLELVAMHLDKNWAKLVGEGGTQWPSKLNDWHDRVLITELYYRQALRLIDGEEAISKLLKKRGEL